MKRVTWILVTMMVGIVALAAAPAQAGVTCKIIPSWCPPSPAGPPPSPVPEPATLTMLAMGACAAGIARKLRRKEKR